MRRIRVVLLTAMMVGGGAAHASGQLLLNHPTLRYDFTVFTGGVAPAGRALTGVSFGLGEEVLRGELEYWGTTGGESLSRPSHGGVSGGFLIQSPARLGRFQFYGAGGYAVYGETFGNGLGSGEVEAKYLGIGAKLKIARGLRLRVEYRVFLLGDSPDASAGAEMENVPNRLTVGLNLQL